MSTYEFAVYFLARYLHIVCVTALVGGTLFYEMVVPVAIDELSPEQQLLIFARTRWVFKWIVWVSASLIIFSGVINTFEHWDQYSSDRYAIIPGLTGPVPQEIPPGSRPGWWWVAHASTGIVAVLIALSLTIGPVPPARPDPMDAPQSRRPAAGHVPRLGHAPARLSAWMRHPYLPPTFSEHNSP